MNIWRFVEECRGIESSVFVCILSVQFTAISAIHARGFERISNKNFKLGTTMKTPSFFFCAALLLAISMNSASAESVTVNLTARVTSIWDYTNALNGQIQIGQLVSGSYTYATNLTDHNASPSIGVYRPPPGQASTRFSVGSLVFESRSVPDEPTFDIFTHAGSPSGGDYSYFHLSSRWNQPLPNGFIVQDIGIYFGDPNGHAPTSDALPTGAPDIQDFPERSIALGGYDDEGAPFSINAEIESVEFVPPLVIEVSPATGTFLSQQHFDAALLLPSGSSITSMQASTGGDPLPLSYPGTCQIAPPNSANRPAILCPNAHTVLPAAGGPTQIQWSVQLTDGTVVNEVVQWTLVP